jgi:starch synthase (maltosyl-transferring)
MRVMKREKMTKKVKSRPSPPGQRPAAGRDEASAPSRIVIENVRPEVDDGRFPVKRTVGEMVTVTADIHLDGHDALMAVLLHKSEGERSFMEVALEPQGNDRWKGAFRVDRQAPHLYTIEAWGDSFLTWRRGLLRKSEAGRVDRVDLLVGAELVAEAAARAHGAAARTLRAWADELRPTRGDLAATVSRALDDELRALMRRHADRSSAHRYPRELRVEVDRARARFSAWYELFPRSTSPVPAAHGTLRDCEGRLDEVAEMGFDVLYLPPIHPIGRSHRKGRNNNPVAEPSDVGSPWAIGGPEGGHTAIHPQLGTLDDFRRLVVAAQSRGIEIALDFAAQCSPDHPWVEEHPQWFRHRPDGTVQYAENPPKKYEDIFPLHFENPDWKGLWNALKEVVLFWVAQGVRIFRVDNPHTKPYAFWEWLIAEVRREHRDVLFLAEAFTRPRVTQQLAKLGFTQSYTYFAWRNTKSELTEYFTELTQSETAQYFRPNLWPNTPDILTEYLQFGGRPAFMSRLVLAATLGASYGIYGPAFELCEATPRSPGSEEYLDSEKYEIRTWDRDRADSLRPFIKRVNRIRRENPALQQDQNLRFHAVDNDQIIAYSKTSADGASTVLVVVNLDPHHTHSGWMELPLASLELSPERPYQAHDLLTDARYLWNGARNFVELDPRESPAHVFRLRRKVRTERDFDYFL